MIPPLVALIAGIQAPTQRNIAQTLLQELKNHGTKTLNELSTKNHEQLPPLAVGHLVPDGPGLPLVRELLRLVTDDQLLLGPRPYSAAINVRAGLYMIHDYLNDTHELVQSAGEDPDTTAAYWHAIVHRREPDYGNSRYWFRRVGSHPAFVELAREVSELLNDSAFRARLRCDRLVDEHGRWDAMAFVDLCQECGRDWSDRAQTAARIQEIEMRRLLEHSCRLACN